MEFKKLKVLKKGQFLRTRLKWKCVNIMRL